VSNFDQTRAFRAGQYEGDEHSWWALDQPALPSVGFGDFRTVKKIVQDVLESLKKDGKLTHAELRSRPSCTTRVFAQASVNDLLVRFEK